MDELLGRAAALCQMLLKPVYDGHDSRVLVAQALNQMDDEGASQAFLPAPALAGDGEQVFRRARSHIQQFVCERISLFPFLARTNDARGQAAQVFH
jgi:hypothetical protein